MMPLIWGFTFTSLRGSILPVITVVFMMSVVTGVSSLYSMGAGCDF